VSAFTPNTTTFERIRSLLHEIYEPAQVEETLKAIYELLVSFQNLPQGHAQSTSPYLSERSITLITYGDTVRRTGEPHEPPLQTLHRFLRERLQKVIDTVHILPFYPWSSDDGFSVIDYKAVDPTLGDWPDIENIGADFRLMFDAVINHASAQGEWFARFLKGDPAFRRRFFVESPETDLSGVTRPRTSPLLTPFIRKDGEVIHVWTTFSADQVDLDYRDPATLVAILEVILFYVRKGAQVLRLDAIAYMWKEAHTACIHLPQTHALIRLMRAVLDVAAPKVTLITETNVPHAENISYWGDGADEAQLVYNFTLPPLLLHTLLTRQANHLAAWINTLKTPSAQTAFFNFTASHDGIGVRPVEGILNGEQLSGLVNLALERGGRVSYKRNPDGSDSPYELNLTYVDACIDTTEPIEFQVRRFLLSQGVMLTLAGVPAIYLHSLVGSHNDLEGMIQSGINRRINRAKLDFDQLIVELETPGSFRARVFEQYCNMLRVRRACSAFHPAGAQEAHSLNDDHVLALERTAPETGEKVLALFNLSGQDQALTGIPSGLNLLTGVPFSGGTLTLAAYEMCWLQVNRHQP